MRSTHLLHVLDIPPYIVQHDHFISVLKGATGHSQGVVTAAVISSSKDDAALVANAAAGARYMLWQGARCHQVLNTSVTYSGPTPDVSPMLAVTGLTSEALAKVCAQFNAGAGAALTVRPGLCSPCCLRCTFASENHFGPTTHPLHIIFFFPFLFFFLPWCHWNPLLIQPTSNYLTGGVDRQQYQRMLRFWSFGSARGVASTHCIGEPSFILRTCARFHLSSSPPWFPAISCE